MTKNTPQPKGPEEIVYQGEMLEIVHQKMQIGEVEKTFEFARRAPGIRLIIPSHNKTKLIITKEYRTELKGHDFRLPGGKMFDSLEEYNKALEGGENIAKSAEETAKKEAIEEVGIEVKNLNLFTTSHCGATIAWDLFYFIASEFEKHPEGQQLEHGEDIEIQWKSLSEVKTLCLEGKVREDRTVATLE